LELLKVLQETIKRKFIDKEKGGNVKWKEKMIMRKAEKRTLGERKNIQWKRERWKISHYV